jgi:hypothetical protein
MDRNKKVREVDVDSIDLDLLKKKTTDLPGLIEYAHTVGGFSIVPTEEGTIKGKAMQAMQEQNQEKLDMILEQMRLLASQAQDIKSRIEISELIYTAKMNFQPDIGQTYYLYEKADGNRVLSLIGPDEWGSTRKYEKAIAKVKLLADHTWKVLEEYENLYSCGE